MNAASFIDRTLLAAMREPTVVVLVNMRNPNGQLIRLPQLVPLRRPRVERLLRESPECIVGIYHVNDRHQALAVLEAITEDIGEAMK